MVNHKDLYLESSKTMEKAKTDFILGFDQIQNRLNFKDTCGSTVIPSAAGF